MTASDGAAAPRVFGIDLGSQRCVVASHTGELVLNELGGMTTATLVSFKGEERLIGESAVLSSSTNPQNTIDALPLMVGQSFESINTRLARIPGQRARIEHSSSSTSLSSDASVVVEYHGEKDKAFTSEQLVGMLLRKLTHPMNLKPDDHVHLAIPSAWTVSEQRALHIAARIGRVQNFSLVTREAALAACYHNKHPLVKEESQHIVIVDMGHTSTSIALVQLTAQGPTILSTACDVSLGAQDFDLALYEYFKQQVDILHGWKIVHHGKEGKRLLSACEKLKRLLSTIEKANVTVENIIPDHDYLLTLDRETMESLWKTPLNRFKELLHQLQVEGVQLASVEIVGGGTRIPSVQQVITNVFSINGLGRRLDSTTSIAVGAAHVVSSSFLSPSEWTSEEEEILEALVAAEEEMEAQDVNLTAIAHERNAIESFIYDMRSKQQDSLHGHALDPVVLDPLLEQAEEWLYSEASEHATLVEMQTKRQEITNEIKLACQVYFNAIANEKNAMEAELEAQAALAEQERLAQGEIEDHDQRKLKKPERIRLILKNKEEGTELFTDGNYQHAVMRYIKSLNHLTKVFDPTPSEQDQLSNLKLSLHLNLAQCFIKLQQWTKVIGNCQEALMVDSKSVKALYRRAIAYEQLQQMDQAIQDIQQALVLAPEDSAVLKMENRLKQWQNKQLAKEKKMWSKAFA